MKDILPEEIPHWRFVESAARNWFERYGFREIRTPLLEATDLFERSVGTGTDIVHKEMYTFERGDDRVSLRPESTASVVRAFVEASRARELSPGYPERLYYIGPMFRYERPQKGRLRQFHQIGVEVLGADEAESDAETIAMLWNYLEAVGVRSRALLLNSVGDENCRPQYRQLLVDWLEPQIGSFCEDCQRRFHDNPLRILDCKRAEDQQRLQEAPRLGGHLCEPCRTHFDRVCESLTAYEIPFRIDEGIVRGLDYYQRTVFEVTAAGLGAQSALLGGGRYDGLVQELGGPEIPGFGFAMGVERLLMAIDSDAIEPDVPDLALIALGPEGFAALPALAERLRKAGVHVMAELRERPMGAQLKRANKAGARAALFVGAEELKNRCYGLKDLKTGTQREIEDSVLESSFGERV